jgi:hypothetical protein
MMMTCRMKSGDPIMSDSDASSKAMIARPADAAGGAATQSSPASRGSPDVDPDSMAEQILGLLTDERFDAARKLAVAAASRFPGHARLQGLRGIFDNRGKAVPRPGHEPGRKEEFQWLRNPPETVRGKWVALVGSEMVGAADTLDKLIETLESKKLTRRPLVHQVD